MSSDQTLDEFASMMGKTLPEHSGKKEEYVGIWPMPAVHIFEADGTVARTFTHILYDYVESLQKLGYDDKEISRLFEKPARIANYVWALKLKEIMRLTREQRVELYSRLFRFISFYRKDIFCESGKNLLWSKKDVGNALKRDFFDLSDSEDAEYYQKLAGKLNASLWSYTELLFFAPHGFGHEFHGPYRIDSKNSLIVREYYDLDADFWDFSKALRAKTITSFEVYRNIEIGFDFFNRTIVSKPIPSHLRKYFITIDNQALAPENLPTILEQLNETIQQGICSVAQLDKKGLLKKFVEAHFFTLKPLAEKLRRDWHPSREAYDVIDREEVSNSPILAEKLQILSTMPYLSEDEKISIFEQMFDPRT